MKASGRLRNLLLVLLGISSLSQLTSATEPISALSTSNAVLQANWKLEVRLGNRGTAYAGERVVMTGILTNVTDRQRTAFIAKNFMAVDFDVIGPDHKPCPLSLYGANMAQAPQMDSRGVLLEPNQSFYHHTVLSQYFDLTRSGTYRLRGRFSPLRLAGVPMEVAESEWIEFRLESPYHNFDLPILEFREGKHFHLSLVAVLPRTDMTTVEPVAINVVVRNVSENPQHIFSVRWDLRLQVTGPDGKPARLTRMGEDLCQPRAGSGHGKTIKPGEAHISRCYLNKVYDTSMPGTYKVWCEWWRVHGPMHVEKYASEPIEIQLLSPSIAEDRPPGASDVLRP